MPVPNRARAAPAPQRQVAELCASIYDVRIDLSATGDIDVQLWMTETNQQLTGDDTGMTADEYSRGGCRQRGQLTAAYQQGCAAQNLMETV